MKELRAPPLEPCESAEEAVKAYRAYRETGVQGGEGLVLGWEDKLEENPQFWHNPAGHSPTAPLGPGAFSLSRDEDTSVELLGVAATSLRPKRQAEAATSPAVPPWRPHLPSPHPQRPPPRDLTFLAVPRHPSPLLPIGPSANAPWHTGLPQPLSPPPRGSGGCVGDGEPS